MATIPQPLVPPRCRLSPVSWFYAEDLDKGNRQTYLTVAALEPAPSPAAVRAALARVHQRHPMLWASFQRLDGDLWFVFDAEQGPHEVRDRSAFSLGEAIEAEFEDCPRGKDCCLHVAVCGAHLLLTYHHSFVDGLSIMVLLRELVAFMDGEDAGAPLAFAAPSSLSPPWPGAAAAEAGVVPEDSDTPAFDEGNCPLAGTWVPTRPDSWAMPALGRDPRTVHHWTRSGRNSHDTACFNGVGEVVARARTGRAGEEVYHIRFHTMTNGLTPRGTLAMLPDGSYFLQLDVYGIEGEYMRRAEAGEAAPAGVEPAEPPSVDEAKMETDRSGARDPKWPLRLWATLLADRLSQLRQRPAKPRPGSGGADGDVLIEPRNDQSCVPAPRLRRARIQWRRLSAEETAQLLASCRQEGTTMQAAITTAVLRAAKTAAADKELRLMTVVQTRREHAVDPSAVGCFVAWLTTSTKLEGSFWEVARAYRLHLACGLAAKRQFHCLGEGCESYDAFVARGERYKASARKWERLDGCLCGALFGRAERRSRTLAVSNRGAFSVGTASRRVSGLYTTRKPDSEASRAMYISTCTVDGVLCLTFTCGTGAFTEVKAAEIADRAVQNLLAAAG